MRFTDYITRKLAEFGDKFDHSGLADRCGTVAAWVLATCLGLETRSLTGRTCNHEF